MRGVMGVPNDLERFGSARREVRTSTSTAVHVPIAVSSSSTGVKSRPSPVATVTWPPRALVAVCVLFATRSMLTRRCVSSVVMVHTLPYRLSLVTQGSG